MSRRLTIISLLAALFCISCQEQQEHTAPAINPRDSVAMMISYGVNTLISDSGVIKYRIVTERWEVNQNRKPSRWIFDKGLFLEQFDQRFHVESYIQCDTAYYYDCGNCAVEYTFLPTTDCVSPASSSIGMNSDTSSTPMSTPSWLPPSARLRAATSAATKR